MGVTNSSLSEELRSNGVEEVEPAESIHVFSNKERGIRHGVVNVKVSSLVPSRGQTERVMTYTVYPRGIVFHGTGGNAEGVVDALAEQNNALCSLPEKVLLQDARVHDLLVMYAQGWHVFPSPEIFSRHSGTCLVVGDRSYQHPAVAIKLGDCFRLGSVGIVVSEIKTPDGVEQRLDSKALQYLRDEAVAFDIAEEEACLAADEGGFDIEVEPELTNHTALMEGATPTKKKKKGRKLFGDNCTIDGDEDGEDYEGNDTDHDDVDDDGECEDKCGQPIPKEPVLSKFFCYMCYESHDIPSDPLVAPCQCRGDTRYLHVQCLQKWYQSTGNGVHAQVIRTTGNGAPACKICGAAYKTLFRNAEGKKVSLLEMNSRGPYITLIVVTKHDTNPSLFNTRFRLNFSSDLADPESVDNEMGASTVAISIGRSSSCNMVVDYRTVSTRHAKIFFENGQFMLQDQRSSNGTMVYLREPLRLPYDRMVKLRMGRSTLSLEASTRWASTLNSLFSRNASGRTTNTEAWYFGCGSCCSSVHAVESDANQPREFDGGAATGATGGLLTNDAAAVAADDDDDDDIRAGMVVNVLRNLNMIPPPQPKLPPLCKLSTNQIYDAIVEVSKRPPPVPPGKHGEERHQRVSGAYNDLPQLAEGELPAMPVHLPARVAVGGSGQSQGQNLSPRRSGRSRDNSPRRQSSSGDGPAPPLERAASGTGSSVRSMQMRAVMYAAAHVAGTQEVVSEEMQIQRLLMEAIDNAGVHHEGATLSARSRAGAGGNGSSIVVQSSGVRKAYFIIIS